MSEPDSTSRRPPPTIELTATDETAANNSAPTASGRNVIGSVVRHAGAALGGAVAMAAIVAGLWFTGYLPARQNSAPSVAASADKSPDIDQIPARLDQIQSELRARQPDAALVSRIAAVEATTKSLGDSVAALTRRVDDAAAAAQTAAAQAKAASGAADQARNAAQGGVQRADLEALASRIAALENATKTLADNATRQTGAADDRAARLTIAAEALRAAVERGASYQAELATVKALGVDQAATAPLEPFAASGVPSAAALARDLAALTPALLHASNSKTGETTFLGRIETSAQQLVRITPIDAPAGNDPPAVVARINAAAARADIATARSDIAKLPDAAKPLLADWVKQADARDAAVAASRRIAADALAAIGRPAPQ